MQKRRYLVRLVDKKSSPVTTKAIQATTVSGAFPSNLLTLIMVIAAVTGGLIVRTGFPDIPLADGDTWGYLHPALSWLSGLGFHQPYGRDWLYPALLAGILNIGGDFRAITLVQRFLGVAGIFIFWLAWRSWLRLRRICRIRIFAMVPPTKMTRRHRRSRRSLLPSGVSAFLAWCRNNKAMIRV
jgi:hypothetical protein